MSLNLVYATDMGYLTPTLVSAASALSWTSDRSRIILHVLDCGVEDEAWGQFVSKLKKWFGVEFCIKRHVVDLSNYAQFRSWHGSRGIYARLLLPEILRNEDWCVYCDGDTLFTDDPLKLESYMDERYALIGHADNDNRVQEKWFPEQGLEWDQSQYVCAGFIVENLKWFRENDGVKRTFDFIAKYKPPFNDQDAYYYVCRGLVNRLENGWGIFGYMVRNDQRPGCIHYASRQPWKLGYMSHRGIMDVERLWFAFAKHVCDLTAKDFGASYTQVRHFYLECVSLWFSFLFSVLGLIPMFRGSVLRFRSQSFSRQQLRELLPCLRQLR